MNVLQKELMRKTVKINLILPSLPSFMIEIPIENETTEKKEEEVGGIYITHY